MILGHLLLLASFTLLGPAPWLIQSPSLPLTITALFLQGAGSGTVVVSSYSACLLSTLATVTKLNEHCPSIYTYGQNIFS